MVLLLSVRGLCTLTIPANALQKGIDVNAACHIKL